MSMRIFGLSIGGSGQTADQVAWEAYQYGYASDYTEQRIRSLNCSQEMKQRIEADVRSNNPGSQLPAKKSSWVYTQDGLYYNEATNTYSNDPK